MYLSTNTLCSALEGMERQKLRDNCEIIAALTSSYSSLDLRWTVVLFVHFYSTLFFVPDFNNFEMKFRVDIPELIFLFKIICYRY